MIRIAVRLPNPLGDVLAATPLLRLLRRRTPDAHLLAVGGAKAVALLRGLDSVDELVELPPREGNGAGGPFAEARALRALRADLIYVLPNSWSAAWAARWARIPQRIGRRARGRGPLLSKRLPSIREPRPMTELYGELASALPGELPRIELRVTDHERERAAARLAALLPERGSGVLAVAPGAAFGPSKIYPAGALGRAMAMAREHTGLNPLVVGAPSEEALLREVGGHGGAPVAVADVGEMKGLLAASEVLLTMDSGARHLGAALGVPQVVLYGPTDPRWSAFARERTIAIRVSGVGCMPCHRKVCPIDHRCMEWIAPGRVAGAVDQALRHLRARPGGAARIAEAAEAVARARDPR